MATKNMRNHYETLEVSQNATEDEIKASYRKLAKQFHPDLKPGDAESEQKFKEVAEAYETLSDSKKKERYDHILKYGGIPNNTSGSPFADFMRARHEQQMKEGEDIMVNIFCSYEETIQGAKKNIVIPTNERCTECDGMGIKKGAHKATCTRCKGQGQVVMTQDFGGRRTVQISSVCPNCDGTGTRINEKDLCSVCDNGLRSDEVTVEVEIPKGVCYGTNMRLVNRGMFRHAKSERGHCYLRIMPEKHELFEMTSKYEIVLPLHITPSEALIGTEIEIPTIDGEKISIKVPAGANHGDKINIPDKGLFHGNQRASMIIVIQTETPKGNVSEVADKLRALENVDTLPRTMKARSKLKNYMKKEKNHGRNSK